MNEQDVKSQMLLATTSPEEAGRNIVEGNQAGVDPDAYKEMAPTVRPTLEIDKRNPVATPRVTEFVSKSTQHASVANEDLERLTGFEKYWHFAKDQFAGAETSRELAKLSYKKVQGEQLSDEERFRLSNLKVDMMSVRGRKDFDYNWGQALPVTLASGATEFVKGLRDNYEILAGMTAAPALAGAAIGGFAGPVGAVGLGATMGAQGFIWGTVAAGFHDNIVQTTGQVYSDLEDMTDEKGQPIKVSDQEKKTIARGIGIMSAVVGTVADVVTLKTVPWLKNTVFRSGARAVGGVSETMASEILKPANSQWLELAKALGQSGVAGGSSASLIEMAKITAEEYSKIEDRTNAGLIQAIKNGTARWRETGARVAEAGATGAAQSASFTAGMRAIGKVAQTAVDATRTRPIDGPERDVTPFNDRQLQSPPVDQASQAKPFVPENPSPDQTSFDIPPSPPPRNPQPSDLVGVEKNIPIEVRGTRALQLQIALAETAELTNNTSLKKFAPEELGNLQRQILEDAGVEHFYLDVDDVRRLSGSEEKAQAVLNRIDPNGITAAQIGASVRISAHDFLKIVEEHPEFSGIAKTEPEGMTADQFKSWAQEFDQKRKELLGPMAQKQGDLQTFADKNVNEKVPSEAETFFAQRLQDKDIHGEQDYLNQPTFTPGLEEVYPKGEVDRFNEMQRQARLAVIESIDNAAEREMNQTLDVVLEIAKQQEREIEAERLVQDPKIKMVESFMGDRFAGVMSENQINRQKRGQRILSIDPKSLTAEQQDRFRNIGTLRKRKVFAKDGMPINEAVQALGARSPEDLLETLATTPTLDEALKKAQELRFGDLKDEAEMAVDLNEAAISKAYNKVAQNHLAELDYVLAKKNWNTTKRMIYRASQPLEKLAELKTRAQNVILDTPVNALKPNQWKVGERRSQGKAMKDILDNRIELFARNKENAALNAMIAREAHIANAKVNRATRDIIRMTTPSAQAELKQAGPVFQNAMNGLLELYNFVPKSKNANRVDAYQKFVDMMVEKGQGDYRIPDDVLEWLTPQTSARKLTTEQYLYVANMARGIMKQAQMKNRLYGKWKEIGDDFVTQQITTPLVQQAENHPNYDPAKAVRGQGQDTFLEKIDQIAAGAESMITNLQHVLMQMDNGDVNGLYNRMILQPLKGTGIHEGPYGIAAANKLGGEVKAQINKHIEIYGKKEWDRLGITKVFVPEFSKIPALRNGRLTKLDLVMMGANRGNAENLQYLSNYGVDKDVITQVLHRELGNAEWDMIQRGFWDVIASFTDRLQKLEMQTKGKELDLVEATPFTHGKKTYRGGYFPAMFKFEMTGESVQSMNEQRLAGLSTDSKVAQIPVQEHKGIVRSPHTKDRVGSNWQIDLSPNVFALGMENLIYDLTMRVPVMDVMKLLQDPNVARAMKGVIGPEKYNLAVNAVAEATRSLSADNIMLFNENQTFTKKVIGKVHGAAAVSSIAFNMASHVVQLESFRQVLIKMGGINGSKHLANTALTLTNPLNLHLLPQFYEFAASIDPSIRAFRENVGEHMVTGLYEIMPKKRVTTLTAYHVARNLQEGMNRFAFDSMLGTIDIGIKVTTVVAAYRQFMAGEAPGWSLEKLSKMTEQERVLAAKGYAANISSAATTSGSNLDRAFIQKSMPGHLFAMYFNDPRNALNGALMDVKKTKYNLIEAVEAAKDGDYKKAGEKFNDNGRIWIQRLILSSLGMAFIGFARGNNPIADDKKEQDMTVGETLAGVPEYMLTRSLGDYASEIFGQNTPFVRDILFAKSWYENKPKSKTVTVPFTQQMTDVADTFKATGMFAGDLAEGMSLADAADKLTKKQFKAMVSTGGLFAGGGLPANAGFKIYNYLNKDEENMIFASGEMRLGGAVAAFKYLTGQDPNQKSKAEMTDEEFTKYMNDMTDKELGKKTDFEKGTDLLKQSIQNSPEYAKEIGGIQPVELEYIKFAESNGDAHAQPFNRDKNGKPMTDEFGNRLPPLSSAYGWYQLMPETWKGILRQAPESLGLTRDGRFKPDQQQKAMEWLVENDYSRILRSNGVSVSIQSIYAAHHFGSPKAVEIYKAPENTKIEKILSESALEQNPWLLDVDKRTGKRKIKTIADLKKYLDKRIEEGRKGYEQALKNGSLTNNNMP